MLLRITATVHAYLAPLLTVLYAAVFLTSSVCCCVFNPVVNGTVLHDYNYLHHWYYKNAHLSIKWRVIILQRVQYMA